VRAAIYLRISQDRTGEELGVDRQRDACRDLAQRRDWNVTEEYVDNDVSAADGRGRPQWERLMDAVETGQVDVVIGWTLDRLCRSAKDRLRLLDVGRARGLVIALVRGSDMDLSTPSGRLAADILGAVALSEIESKSDRQKAAHRQAAAQGRRIGGRRPFGFEQDGMTVRPAEAKALVAAYNDYLAGEPLIAIARRWNEAGLVSGWKRPDGTLSQWNHSGVRSVLRNARYAGFRVHNGEIAGKAQWPALVPEHTYRAVIALLDSTAAEFKPKGGRRLLTRIARCGVCDEGIFVGGNKAGGAPVYRCPTGRHVTRRAEPVEEWVTEMFLRRLATDDRLRLAFAEADEGGRAAELSAEAERLRGEMDTIALERMQRKITPRQFALMNAELVAQLEEVERAMSASGGSAGLREFIDGGVTRERWDELGVDKQRVFIAKAMSIRLYSGGRGVRNPPPETIKLHWRTDALPSEQA